MLLIGAVVSTVLAVAAATAHTVRKGSDGRFGFVVVNGSGTTAGHSKTPAIGGRDAIPGEGPWTSLSFSKIPESCRTLGASIDKHGGITLEPAAWDSTDSRFIAIGTFHDTLDEMGWSSLSVRSADGGNVEDGVKMYAAGVIEGYLTAKRITQFFDNSRALLEMNSENTHRTPELKKALQNMVTDMAVGADDPASQATPETNQGRLVFLQTWGIRDGYHLSSNSGTSPSLLQDEFPKLSMVDMFILNSDGVIDEIEEAYGGKPGPDTSFLIQQTALKLRPRRRRSKTEPKRIKGHCTGLVRVAPDNKEVYFAHTTWEPFSEMTRIWKVYDMPLKDAATRKISFSSYPGCVSSTDDYYLMDNGLAITETTLNIPKPQTYSKDVKTMDFIRIMVANRLASNAEDWGERMYHSATGTYSSQWMILDYSKFKPGEQLAPGTFYVLEQAPTISHLEDMTAWLNQKGYWASYDRAFFDDVRSKTGDAGMVVTESKPNSFLYTKDETPRAQIIRRTIHSVNSLDSMRAEMTRNTGTSEPVDQVALREPRFTISARDDLKNAEENSADGSPEGGVDAKVTSSCLFKSLMADAISSPSHTNMPSFKWTNDGQDVWPGYPHEGLPDAEEFDWVRVDPNSKEMLRPSLESPCL